MAAALGPATPNNTPDDFSAEQAAIAQARSDRLASMAGAGLEARRASPGVQPRDIPMKQNIPARRYVYGTTRVGGAVFFQDNDNPNLYIGLALSDGEIESVDGAYFGSEEVPLTAGIANSSSRWASRFTLESTVGTSTQTASALLTGAFPSLTSDFRQRGVARAVCKLHWGENAENHGTLWGTSLIPIIAVTGTKIYDPRDSAQSVTSSATWEASRLPPLQIAHAMTHVWGAPLDSSYINYESVASAANVCAASVSDMSAGSFTLFQSSGEFRSGSDYGRQIADMLTAMAGSIYFEDGKYVIKADQPEPSRFVVTDADILTFINYEAETRLRDNATAIKARYYDTTLAADTISVTVEDTAATLTEGLREKVLDVPYTDNSKSAQVLAWRHLKKTRAGRRCTLQLTDIALWLSPTERVTIQSASFPWLDGDYTVEERELDDVGAVVQLREYAADAYANPNTYVV